MTSLKNRVFAAALFVAGVVGWFGLVPLPAPSHAQLSQASVFVSSVGGTANAQTLVVANVSSYADLKGVAVTFIPSGTNTGPMTLNVNGFGAVNVLRLPSGAVLGGSEVLNNSLVTVMYGGSTFELISPQDTTPIGTAIDIRGTVAPPGYLIEDGSCVSQTTYAALFAVVGAAYGSCSAGLFALPDSRGTMFAARDNQGSNGAANRITTAGSNCNAVSSVLCGAQSQILTLAQLPTGITSANTTVIGFSVATVSTAVDTGISVSNVAAGGNAINGVTAAQQVSSNGSFSIGSLSLTSNNTSGSAHSLLNPILVGLRAVKY